MPVDVVRLRLAAERDDVRAWAGRFTSASPRLLVRVDRVEPAKNILRGFDAFRLLLDRRKDLRDTRFIACLYGTRHTMPEYRQYMDRIYSQVADIQRQYPGSIELFVEDYQERALGALLCYDALLVNPLQDGMNLVAMEGAALNERSGVLVLSSGAGAFNELGSAAIGIHNPESVAETAEALERALCMSAAERAARARTLRSLSGRHSPLDWLEQQVQDLKSVRTGQRPG
jgi:trehalose 6-phosphate synthase